MKYWHRFGLYLMLSDLFLIATMHDRVNILVFALIWFAGGVMFGTD